LANQGIQYYVDAQLAWNPRLDVEKLLSDYYKRAYGPALEEMETYWNLMTDTRNEILGTIKHRIDFQKRRSIIQRNGLQKQNLF
jgi:alpha-glucuronidase